MKRLTLRCRWLWPLLVLMVSSCCGSEQIQQSKVVDTTIQIPRDTISLKADHTIEKAARMDGNLQIALEQRGRDQLQDSLQHIHDQYRQLIRQLTENSAQDTLIARYNQSRSTIQGLRDSLVTLKAMATRTKDSIRVVEQTTVEKESEGRSPTPLIILLLAGLVTGIALSLLVKNVTE